MFAEAKAVAHALQAAKELHDRRFNIQVFKAPTTQRPGSMVWMEAATRSGRLVAVGSRHGANRLGSAISRSLAAAGSKTPVIRIDAGDLAVERIMEACLRNLDAPS